MQVVIKRRRSVTGLALSALAVGLLQVMPTIPAATAAEAVTRLASTPYSSTGSGDVGTAAVSGDGRFVAFTTTEALSFRDGNSNAGATLADRTTATDVYRKDLATGQTILVSTDSEGFAVGNSAGENVAISDDGDVVVHYYRQPGVEQPSAIYWHRLSTGQEVRVDDDGSGGFGSSPSFFSVSGDGNRVAFISYSPLYLGGDVNGGSGVYVRDMTAPTTSQFLQYVGDAEGAQVAISGDGSTVGYTPSAYYFPPPPGAESGYLCPYCLVTNAWDGSGSETLVNSGTSSNFADPAGLVGPDALSRDGQQVAFWSDGNAYLGQNPGTNYPRAVFRFDATSVNSDDFGLRRASETAPGVEATAPSGGVTNDWPKGAISADGQRVAFTSQDSFGLPGVSGGSFIKDFSPGTLTLASRSASDAPVTVAGTTMASDGVAVAFITPIAATAADTDASRDVFVRNATLPLEGFSLTVSQPEERAGVSDIDTDDIDLSLLPLGNGQLESAPLRATPLRATPLRATPLRATPLRATPLRATPLRATPLRATPLRASPLRATTLPPIPLSTVPLLLDGGWSPRLVGTPFEGLALQSVTLQQVLALTDQPNAATLYPLLYNLSLSDIDIAATPLGSAPLQVFLFAGVPLSRMSDQVDLCTYIYPALAACTAASTLQDLYALGATSDQLSFVPRAYLRDADLSGSPIFSYDVGSVDVDAAGLGGLPATVLPPGMVDASKCSGACDTLSKAVAADAITEDAQDSRFGLLFDLPEVDDLYLQLGDLVRGVVDPAKVDYAGVDLDPLVGQDPIDESTPVVTYTAKASVACASSGGLSLSVQLPDGFRYVTGSSRLDFQGSRQVADPTSGSEVDLVGVDQVMVNTEALVADFRSSRLYWEDLPSCSGADRALFTLTFDASPGVELGTWSSSATLSNYSFDEELGSEYVEVSVADTAPVTVEDAFDSAVGAASAGNIEVVPGHLYVSHISSPTDVDTYELPSGLEAGTRVTAVLSHLQADFDLFLDGPVASPLRATPLRATPLRATPIEDLNAPGAQGGDVIEPETLQDVPLRATFLSQSATAGTEDEQVTTVLTRASTEGDPVTLAVTHHLGSSSASPYLLQVTIEKPIELACPSPGVGVPFAGVLGTNGSLPSIGNMSAAKRAAVKTLFLTNKKRLGDAFGPTAAQSVLDKLDGLSQRTEVGGLVLPVDGNAGIRDTYASWDANRCNPEAANDVVRAVGALVDSYASQLPALRYITFVGDDDIVPFARIPDGASVANQVEYYPEVVFAGKDNPVSAAFGRAYVLSDNPLLAKEGIDFLGHQLPVPDYAGGRLVETPAEIIGTIDQYVARPFILKNKTLVTGYDFLADLTPVLDSALGGASRQLLNTEDWTKSNLEQQLAAAPTIVGINAHYDHSNALPAIGNSTADPAPQLFSSKDLKDSALPPGALMFTLGCQGGLSVPGRAWVAAATTAELQRLQDFAQVLAQKKANGFLGNTGFGYGDSVLIAYGERFLQLFAQNLDGTMTVGQAVIRAKQQYLEDGLVGVYDEKVLNEATFYGLPFVTVGPQGTAGPAPTAPAAGAVPTETLFGVPVRSDSITSISYTENQAPSTPTSPSRGTYYTVPGQQPLVEHWRPIQPAIQKTLTSPPTGSYLGDVWFTGLTSMPNVEGFDPVFSAPTVDSSTFSPEPLVRSVAFPVSLGTVTPRGTLALFPGQYRSGNTPGTGTQLRFSKMSYKVFYPTTATAERPTFTTVEGTAGPTGTVFRIGITGAQGATVLAKPANAADWIEVPLTQSEPGVWTGTTGVQVEEYLVQAANQGRVGTTRAKGVNYKPSPADATVTAVPADGLLDADTVVPWYREPVTVTLATGDPQVASIDGGPFTELPVTITTDGVHRVEHRLEVGGATSTMFVAIDQTNPGVTFTSLVNGAVVGASTANVVVTCNDVTSGVDGCVATNDGVPYTGTLITTPGTHTLSVVATDRAGNTTTVSRTYEGARYQYGTGFYSPVDNIPVVNEVAAGRVVPVRFRLTYEGRTVTDPTKIRSVTFSKLASCPSGAADLIEETISTTGNVGNVQYDSGNQRFHYNWATGKSMTGHCYRLTVTAVDGSTLAALFRFK